MLTTLYAYTMIVMKKAENVDEVQRLGEVRDVGLLSVSALERDKCPYNTRKTVPNRGSRSDQPRYHADSEHQLLTLTCDVDFRSKVSWGHDLYTYKN